MSLCEGNGNCIKQCICICYNDENNDIPSEVCRCSHRNHNKLIGGNSEYYLYCKSDCPHNCELIECHNYRMCKQKRPQILLSCNNGMCLDCAIHIGRIAFLDKKDNCPICLDNKDMIEINCEKHNVCLDCWKNWSETCTQIPLTCPLCRNPIWK